VFSEYPEGDSKGETILRCTEEYLQEQNISFENITTVAIDGAPAMVGRYRGFATLLKQKVPHVVIVHCVLHRIHLVAKKLSGELTKH
jgi:tRNA A37 threonylcarbamoyltransferase TsaD